MYLLHPFLLTMFNQAKGTTMQVKFHTKYDLPTRYNCNSHIYQERGIYKKHTCDAHAIQESLVNAKTPLFKLILPYGQW